MNFRFWIVSAVSIPVVLALAVSGCGAKRLYSGEKRPADQVAVLEIGKMKVLMVDETPTPDLKAGKVELLPGEHYIRTTLDIDLYEGPVLTLVFDAEAGVTYLLDADVNMKGGVNWTPWIKNLATGEIVGSMLK